MALSKSNRLPETDSRPAVQRRRGDPVPVPSTPAPYVLATGEAAAYRLRILHGLYGPGTRRVLLEAGLRRGMRVADLGCGVGMVTALLAELVGPEGHVVGIDSSAAQLAQARERLHCRQHEHQLRRGECHRHGLAARVVRPRLLPIPPAPSARAGTGLARDGSPAQAERHPGV